MRPIIVVLLIFLFGGCSEADKECRSAADCNDSNACTDDSCDPQRGCLHQNNTAGCDDQDVCTIGDACRDGVCYPGTKVHCDDGDICTDDSCDPAAGCQHVNNHAPCDDQNACTIGDACQDGACMPGGPHHCDDGNPCTDNDCNPETGDCLFPGNSNPCDDLDLCTTDDHCSGGACTGTAYSCDDDNQCTEDACTGDGNCSHENITGDCDDHDPCTGPDTCQDGVCTGPVTCTGEVVVMVYLDGDNDLDSNAMDDLQEMQAAGLDDAAWLRVFVLHDRSSYADWSDTRLYEVHSGDRTELDGPALGITAGASHDELNMGDPDTLSAFIDDVQAINGAGPMYFLILWDHGDGWRRRSTGVGRARSYKEVCGDDTSDDWLQTRELHPALVGKGLSLVGFDACLEGMVEIAYEIRDDAQIMVASEESEPVEGWEYTGLLATFMNSPDRTPDNFGTIAVDTFIDSSTYGDVTLSVLDLSAMTNVAAGCDGATAALTALPANTWNSLCQGLDWFGGWWWPEPHADLVQLFEKAKAVDSANAGVYDNARNLVESAVLYEGAGSEMPFAHGLAVYFECQSSVDPDYDADTIQWAADTNWDEMLRSH